MGRDLVGSLELDDRLGHLPIVVQFHRPVEVFLGLGAGFGRRVSASEDRPRRDRKHCQHQDDLLQYMHHFVTFLLHSPCLSFA